MSLSQINQVGNATIGLGPPLRAPSFRDPAGRLIEADGRIFRWVSRVHRDDLLAYQSSPVVRRHVEAAQIVSSRMLEQFEAKELAKRYDLPEADNLDSADVILEHERIPFPSFPYEWPAEMLEAAGQLTIELAGSLLADGLGLKDATPYNVLFRGPAPVFVDVLSIERRDPREPLWMPYAQFVRTFLLPLVVHKRFGVPLDSLLLARRDGLEPDDVYRMCGLLAKLRPPILTLVSFPVWLGARGDRGHAQKYSKRQVRDPEQARYILGNILGGLQRQLSRVGASEKARSRWSDYVETCESYTEAQLAQKTAFIDRMLEQTRPRRLLDAGANTGLFSLRAARAGASVVAIDSDAVAVGRLWRQARAEHLDVIPLDVNLARPSPSVGWRNGECPAFLDRARGTFDAIFLLALLHHLLVTERIPLEEIIDLAADLTTDLAVIEFVGTDDPMFQRLLRGRDALYEHLTPEVFEAAARKRFRIVRSEQLPGSRRLYLLQKTSPSGIDAAR